MPQTGFTLGLGEIEVNSALNQKLNADIELLSATPEDTENIIVKLASRKEFTRAGLDRPYLLNDLRFKAEIVNDVPYIRVSSSSPIREPFLNFLIEIDWPNGHMLREYTVLLDPPVFMTQSASTDSVGAGDSTGFQPAATQAAASAPVVAPTSALTVSSAASAKQPAAASQQKTTAAVSQAPAYIQAPAVQQQTPINQQAESYRIKAGDTAWSLAKAMRPDTSVSVPQMMFAILRANPESFIQENINGLKRGYIIRKPDAAQIAAISKADAQAMVLEHKALWSQYQQSLAGQATSAMATDTAAAAEAETGQESSLEQAPDARLDIVSAGAGTGSAATGDKTAEEMTALELRTELMLAREHLETAKVENEALQQRVTLLEQHAEKMKGMLSIEDEELSRVQSLNLPAEDTAGTTAAADETVEEVASDETVPSEETVTDVTSDTAAAEELAEIAEAGAGDEVPEDAVFTDEIAEQETTEATVETDAVAETAAPQSRTVADTRPADDLLTGLLNDPVRLAAAGGGLLLIATLIGLIIKRRKPGDAETASATATGAGDIEVPAGKTAEAAADTQVQQDVEAETTHGKQQSESKKATSDEVSDTALAEETKLEEAEKTAVAEEEKPRDDVIAEADVYLAYGIYQQAEDILTQAIARHPDRDDYMVKLAETYYASKNADAFIEAATLIKDRVADDSSEWKKVMQMGQDLCAGNSLFQAAMAETSEETAGTASMDSASVTNEAEAADLTLVTDAEAPELPDMEAKDVTDEAVQISEAEKETQSAEIAAEPLDEIEFDLTDTGAVEEAVEEDEFLLDIDASELEEDLLDEAANLSTAVEESPAAEDINLAATEEQASEVGLTEEDRDTDNEEMDLGLEADTNLEAEVPAAEAETEAEPVAEEEVLLDLSDEVEIDSLDVDESKDLEAAINDLSTEEDDFDFSSLDDVDEISTKLDLARAYLDMGDNEGTRSILEEVLLDGNETQKQEANELMAKLN